MSEHESIRRLLAMAAAGAVTNEEHARVHRHVRECDVCRRELEAWSAYTRGLGSLPQPVVPVGLVERTKRRIMQEQAAAAERRQNALALAFLTLFAWIVGVSGWFILRLLTGGDVRIIGSNILDAATWAVVSTALGWVTAGAAALLISKTHRELGKERVL
jgi:hypothetical protein